MSKKRARTRERQPIFVDGPTRERLTHGTVIAIPSDAAGIPVRLSQAPLDRYNSRREITERQFFAGDRLRIDYEVGVVGVRNLPEQSMPLLTSRAGSVAYPENRLAAIERYERAVRAVGPSLAGIVVAIVCEELSAEELARRRGAAGTELRRLRDQLKWYFRAGLSILGDHYDFPLDAVGSSDSVEVVDALS